MSLFFTIKMLIYIIFIVIVIVILLFAYIHYRNSRSFKLDLIEPPASSIGPNKQNEEFGYFKFVNDKGVQYFVIANSPEIPTYLKIFSPFDAYYINDLEIIDEIIKKMEITNGQIASGKSVAKNSFHVSAKKPDRIFHINSFGQVVWSD